MSTTAPILVVLQGRTFDEAAPLSLENSRLCRESREEARRRHEAEARLQRSEAYLAELQRLSRAGTFGWNLTTREFSCSGETCRLLGFDAAAKPTLEEVSVRIHPDDLASVTALFHGSELGPGTEVDFECRTLLPGEGIKCLRLAARATRNVRGELELVGAAMDVTKQGLAGLELGRSEEALSRLRADVARVERLTSLGVLAASIAHEVNQPLTGIVTNASTCLRMLAAEPPFLGGALETARLILRDSRRAAAVITRLRALFMNDESGSRWIDLNEATREVLALSRDDLQRNRVLTRTELASNLAPVRGDRVQLQQVILNLLLNASEAMHGVDDRPRILTIRTATEDGARVRLSVEDVGVGLEPEKMGRVFEPFYTTKAGGMGIGLSVSRSIIDGHRGRLWAEPNAGPGTTFTFSIPIGAAGATEATSAIAQTLPA